MASIEGMPASISTDICKHLDLKSLDALTRASPHYAAVTTLSAAEIVEAIVTSTHHESMAVLFRANALCRAPPASRDPASALQRVLADATAPLPLCTPAADVLAAVRAFTHVHCLALSILTAKLEYLKTLRFEELLDPQQPYEHYEPDEPERGGVPYEIGVLTPPSWAEEERCMRGLWRIRLVRELAKSLCSLVDKGEDSAVDKDDQGTRLAEMQGLLFDSLRDVLTSKGQPRYFDGVFHQDEVEEMRSSLTSLSRDVTASSHPAGSEDIAQAWKSIPSQPPPWVIKHPRGFLGRLMQSGSTGYRSFFRARKSSTKSPLHVYDWTVLRRLGLGIWTSGRMAEELRLLTRFSRRPRHGVTVEDYWRRLDDDRTFGIRKLYMQEMAKVEG